MLAHLASECGEVIITATSNGRHRKGSLHYSNEAIDLRVRHLLPTDRIKFVACLQDALPQGRVILERNPVHVHMELRDPPRFEGTMEISYVN